ncbi:Excisionase [Escherichia coli O55:H7 str. USDA 5905]|nr:Excisionase [Escherichia coli O55:H7 str. USDA 5905]
MARLILLTEWAKEEFSEPVPTPSTLSKYAKAGMIFPLPKKSWKTLASGSASSLCRNGKQAGGDRHRSPCFEEDTGRWRARENIKPMFRDYLRILTKEITKFTGVTGIP